MRGRVVEVWRGFKLTGTITNDKSGQFLPKISLIKDLQRK